MASLSQERLVTLVWWRAKRSCDICVCVSLVGASASCTFQIISKLSRQCRPFRPSLLTVRRSPTSWSLRSRRRGAPREGAGATALAAASEGAAAAAIRARPRWQLPAALAVGEGSRRRQPTNAAPAAPGRYQSAAAGAGHPVGWPSPRTVRHLSTPTPNQEGEKRRLAGAGVYSPLCFYTSTPGARVRGGAPAPHPPLSLCPLPSVKL